MTVEANAPTALPAHGRQTELSGLLPSIQVRTWLRIARILTSAGVYPSMDRMPDVPLAKRKASRPPGWMMLPLPAGVEIRDRVAGELDLPVATRTYAPERASHPLPIVVFMHGGGFVNGGLDAMQFFCAHLAVSAEVLVLSVDYPLAPESVFPEALDASFEALRWAADHGPMIGGDAEHLFVAGDSAGGNLAAALCLRARREGSPRVRGQVLIYPTLDATQSTPRLLDEAETQRRERFTYYRYYTGEAEPADELISPLLAETVEGLPPAVILTAEADALREDGVLYAAGRATGVPVRFTNYLGVPHGFLSMPRLCRTAASQAILEIAAALRDLAD